MRRFAIVTMVAVLVKFCYPAAAHAAAESQVWVEGNTVYYRYANGGPSAHLVVRSSGDTYTVDDAWGILAGNGVLTPVEDVPWPPAWAPDSVRHQDRVRR